MGKDEERDVVIETGERLKNIKKSLTNKFVALEDAQRKVERALIYHVVNTVYLDNPDTTEDDLKEILVGLAEVVVDTNRAIKQQQEKSDEAIHSPESNSSILRTNSKSFNN